MLKKVFIFTLCLLPWFLSSIIPVDYSYFDTLKLPFFCPPKAFYGIAWSLIYILLATSIYGIVTNYKFRDIPKSYKTSLAINYVLYHETNSLREKSSKFLDPYVLLSLFASILSLTIYVMNTVL